MARTLCWKPSTASVVHISARCQGQIYRRGNRTLGFVGAHSDDEETACRRKHMLKLREQTVENLTTVLPCAEVSVRATRDAARERTASPGSGQVPPTHLLRWRGNIPGDVGYCETHTCLAKCDIECARWVEDKHVEFAPETPETREEVCLHALDTDLRLA